MLAFACWIPDATAQSADSLVYAISETYKDLNEYHFAGQTEVRLRVGRQTRTQSYTVRAAERFPTHFYMAVEGEEAMRFVSDGKQTWIYDGVTNEYLHRAWVLRPGKEREDVPDMFSTYKHLADRPSRNAVEGDTLYEIGSVEKPATLLEVIPQLGPGARESISYRLWVEKETHLVLREDLTRYIPNSPYGGPMTITQTTQYEIAIAGSPVPDSLFRFELPEGAKEVQDLDRFPNVPKSLHGKRAKSFTLNDLAEDRPVALDSLVGNVVVLNFWATWCGPCRAEMDALNRLQKEWGGDGLRVLAVNQEEQTVEVIPYIEQENYIFDVLLDRFGLVSIQYEVDEIPTTFVIDREGVIREHLIGARTESDFREAIGRWLSTP